MSSVDKTPGEIVEWVCRSESGDEAIVECEGMSIATIVHMDESTWMATRIACMHHSHGTHSRFENILSEEQRHRIRNSTNDMVDHEECDDCDDGWYWMHSPVAKKQIELIKQFGIFRGVQIGIIECDPLHTVQAHDMVSMFLSGISQFPDSSSPSGRQPDRAFFYSKEKI